MVSRLWPQLLCSEQPSEPLSAALLRISPGGPLFEGPFGSKAPDAGGSRLPDAAINHPAVQIQQRERQGELTGEFPGELPLYSDRGFCWGSGLSASGPDGVRVSGPSDPAPAADQQP